MARSSRRSRRGSDPVSGSSEALRTPTGCGLPAAVAVDLEAAGLDLAGVLSVERYDAMVPPLWRSTLLQSGARSVVVLACGGRSFERALEATPHAEEGPHPVDAFARIHAERAAHALALLGNPTRALFYWQSLSSDDAAADSAGFADFVALARAAGLGEPGRLRVLLHPEFGPWMAIRALLLSTLALEPTPPLSAFEPCVGCHAPCASACPGGALDLGRLDLGTCLETRERVRECETACVARRACVIGNSHAYSPHWEAHFTRSSLRSAQSRKRKAQLPG